MKRALFLLLIFALLPFAQAKTVIIDAGHGGKDLGGKYGKVYEKHLALDTAMRLQYYLQRKGYRTVMVRTNDSFVSLQDRAALANKYHDAIFVSVHYNYTWKSHVEGLETFYCTSQSRALADACHEGMHSQVSAADRGVKSARYYVLRHCKLPSILIEGGFLSHSREREKIKQGAYRDQLVRGIVDGIVRFDRSGEW
jgi:N-acetylmuramoyl-L-alanine amidase